MKSLILEYLFWSAVFSIFIGMGILIGIEVEKSSKKVSLADNIVIIKRCGEKIISIN